MKREVRFLFFTGLAGAVLGIILNPPCVIGIVIGAVIIAAIAPSHVSFFLSFGILVVSFFVIGFLALLIMFRLFGLKAKNKKITVR